jgi:EmrB/QacA subfamily drug resistance transporter
VATAPTGAPSARRDDPIPWTTWRLAAVIVFGAFMAGLDTSVVNVGLETVARSLDADLADAQWVATAYLLALGGSLPACAWLGRRVGVGRLWLTALAGFTVTSALCAVAGSVGQLVAARVLQGLCAGLLIPAGQTVLGQAVGPARLGRVMAVLGVAVTLAPALGPVVGGVVVHTGSWPWLFLVNLPLGAAGLALGWRYVPRGNPGHAGRLDVGGLVLASAGVPLVVYALTAWSEQRSLSGTALAALALGGLLLAAFVRRTRRTPAPVLDLGLFARPTFRAAAATAGFTGAALFGAGLLFPLYFQVGRGEGPLTAGLLLVSLSLGTAAALPLTGRLVDRYGGGLVSTLGGVATVVTTAPFTVLPLDVSEPTVQALLLVRGAALAFAVMPAGVAAYKAVTETQLPDATAQVNILQRLGGALGGAVFAVVVASRLTDGPDVAFHTAFAWLTGASVLGLVTALLLLRAERREARVATPDVPLPTSPAD